VPTPPRALIINCDDLGSSHGANLAIRRAITQGVARSATLMVPCPWALEGARMLAGADVGVHLTFTAEYPAYRWRSLTGAVSLHDEEGFFPATTEAAIAWARPEDIYLEGRAQIAQALAWGVDVTHLDSHMGVVQVDARLFEIYLDLAVEFRLPLRMVGPKADAAMGFEARRRAAERGVLFTDHFIPHWPNDTRAMLSDLLPNLRPGVTEVYAHPVEDGPELRAYDPDQPDLRANDAVALIDPGLAARAALLGVALQSYRPLRDRQRAA
jgi:predicted glycoside hydrolase/deacetylase ChbG (UPF0249 family)